MFLGGLRVEQQNCESQSLNNVQDNQVDIVSILEMDSQDFHSLIDIFLLHQPTMFHLWKDILVLFYRQSSLAFINEAVQYNGEHLLQGGLYRALHSQALSVKYLETALDHQIDKLFW